MSMMDKLSSMFKPGDDIDDEYDYEDEDDYEEPAKPARSEVSDSKIAKPFEKKSAPQPRKKVSMTDSAVCVFKPTGFDESREIVDTFLEDKTVLMNFEGVDLAISQRILDIVTGACIAVGGNLQKVSNYIFIATPASVDVSGEFQDSLTGAFDSL
ncbi:MAG: cell division protein SepF [Lachnospiraceae bacterium]|nr:cell division protein SepF [Lachnospiraceae bacterium]